VSPGPERLRGDQQIIRANGRTRRFEGGAKITRGRRVLFIEWNDADGTREKGAQAFGIFAAALATCDPIPKLEQHDR